jgi:hypothetical protein
MKTKNFAAVAALAFALAGCGGGGGNNGGAATAPTTGNGSTGNNGGSNTGGSGSNTNASATISLLTPKGASAASLTTTGDVVNDSFAYVNTMRSQPGLAQLT